LACWPEVDQSPQKTVTALRLRVYSVYRVFLGEKQRWQNIRFLASPDEISPEAPYGTCPGSTPVSKGIAAPSKGDFLGEHIYVWEMCYAESVKIGKAVLIVVDAVTQQRPLSQHITDTGCEATAELVFHASPSFCVAYADMSRQHMDSMESFIEMYLFADSTLECPNSWDTECRGTPASTRRVPYPRLNA
jgi:hypothetical protein